MNLQRRDRWRGERSITGFMNFLLFQHQWRRCYDIYEITLVYSFELVTSQNIFNFFSNLLLVVIFSCFFGCCGKTILIFFFLETLFLFIWISFFWLLKSFLDICFFCLFVLHMLIFLLSVTLSGITVLSSNRLNYNWKWKKIKCWALMRGLLFMPQ